MKILNWTLLTLTGALAFLAYPIPLTAQYDFRWQTNGNVNAAIIDNNILYIGGTFSYVGEYTGNMNALNMASGQHDASWPVINNDVYCIIPDGSGGWFVGGSFREVGGEARFSIARIRPDKSVDPSWDPGVAGTVYIMAVDGNTLYIGGNFTNVNGQPRKNIAAIDIPSGTVTPWNPEANNQVRSLEPAGGVVYAGGFFTSIGGELRNFLAALDKTTGLATAFDAKLSGVPTSNVYSTLVKGSTIYIGGNFLYAGSDSRRNIAQIDINTGLATSWNPDGASNSVFAIRQYGDRLFVSGFFSSISGVSRRNIASFDMTTGLLDGWNPNPSGLIYNFHLDGSVLYVVGQFTSIDGQARNRVAALDIDKNTNAVTSWDPNAGNGWEVFTICPAGGSILIGGSNTSVNGAIRNNLAAIDLTTNKLLPWNPNANGAVHTLAISGGTVYAGGDFTMVDGQARSRLAAIDAYGAITAWNPGADMTVRTLLVAGNTVYAGGDFNHAGGQARKKLAALDATVNSNNALAWNPEANATVRTLAMDGTNIYAGGDFTMIDGASRARFAAFELATHTLQGWTADANGAVKTLVAANGAVYAGGDFTNIGGEARNRIAALSPGGLVTSWNPNAGGSVHAIAVTGSVVYVAGTFLTIGGKSLRSLAALDAGTSTDNAIAWNPFNLGMFSLNCLAANGSHVYAGGSQTSIDYARSFHLTFLPGIGDLLASHASRLYVRAQGHTAFIRWTGEEPAGSAFYEVQRSADGRSYNAIATQAATGRPVYEVTDRELKPGLYYYRIKITETDNRIYYSEAQQVKIAGDGLINTMRVWINGGKLYALPGNGNTLLSIYTTDGRNVLRKVLACGLVMLELPGAPAAAYHYFMRDATGTVKSGAFFRNRQ